MAASPAALKAEVLIGTMTPPAILAAESRDDPFGGVGRPDGDALAGLHARREERASCPAALGQKLRETQAGASFVLNGSPVAEPFGGGGENAGQGRRQRGGQRGRQCRDALSDMDP